MTDWMKDYDPEELYFRSKFANGKKVEMDEDDEWFDGTETEAYPRIRVIQPQDEEEVKTSPGQTSSAGKFSIEDWDDQDKITIRPLDLELSRQLPVEGEFGETGGQLRCMSLDMKEGIGDPGKVCSECVFAKWSDEGDPPECNKVATFLVAIDGVEGEYLLSLRRKSYVDTYTPIYRQSRRFGRDNFTIELHGVRNVNKIGQVYYSIVARNARPINPDLVPTK